MFVTVKNWKEFQHYKDRCPPWIKLHHAILDDFEFHGLPVASRALAPCIWLIASEHKEGVVDANYEKLAFRLRQTARQIEDALTPLIERGFLLVVQSDSALLADCKQLAVPETERETEKSAARFAEFWSGYPKKIQKPQCSDHWRKKNLDSIADLIIASVRHHAAGEQWHKEGGQYVPNPLTFLRQERWEQAAAPSIKVDA